MLKLLSNLLKLIKNNSLFVIISLVIFTLIIVLEIINERFWLNDFKVYYLAAKSFVNGGSVYGVSFGLDSGFYKYSPFVLLLFAPLTLLPFQVAAIFHYIIIAMATIGSILIVNSLINKSLFKLKNNKGKGLLFIALLCIMNHLVRELHLGNVNMIIVLLLSCGIYFTLNSKHLLAGFCIALALLIKPYLLVVVVPLLFHKKLKTIFFIVLSALVMLLLPLVFVGFSKWFELNIAWAQSMLEHSSYLNSNHNFTSLIKYYFFAALPNSSHLYFLVLVVVVYTLIFFSTLKNKMHKNSELENTYLMISYFTLLALLPNILITDTEHFLFCLPLILFLLHYFTLHKKSLLLFFFIPLIVFYGGNSSDLFGSKLSNKFEEMGLLGIANFMLILLTIYATNRLKKEQVL